LQLATRCLAETALFDFLKLVSECKDKEITTDPRRITVIQPSPFETQFRHGFGRPVVTETRMCLRCRPWELFAILVMASFNVATDQGAHARFRLSRKARGKDHDGSQRASLAVDRCVGPFVVAPDLCSGERDEKAEDDTQRWQHPGGDGLE
jgi:hypothetical protein